MFLPEYTITTKILKNIGQIEYAKAIVETTPILPNWEKQLAKEALIRTIADSFRFAGATLQNDLVKKYVEDIETPPTSVQNFIKTMTFIQEKMHLELLEEADIKEMQEILAGNTQYRKRTIPFSTAPEELLAEMVELMDWYNSLDARETPPIIKAGILKIRLEHIVPFDQTNFWISNFAARIALVSGGYAFKNYLCPEEWFSKTKWDYTNLIRKSFEEQEYTEWLEYFTEGLAIETANIKEKVLLLARDTKVAKATGRVRLSERQEKIVEYLQDYGLLQNKDFARVFAGISEDSVLRDLKALIEKGIVIKTGSTKSSRYELS